VVRPFATHFQDFYFFNQKAEEFKWRTRKFLDHGLFEFWKSLESRQLTLFQRRVSQEKRLRTSNSSSSETPNTVNFIGQVHLSIFYVIVSILTVICIVVFSFACAIGEAKELLAFLLKVLKSFSLQLFLKVNRLMFWISRLINRKT
jgi:hypothetical protein